jgi:hypothetical protein
VQGSYWPWLSYASTRNSGRKCFVWSLNTLGTERRLRVFENGVLRKISASKGDEATGE